MTTDTLSWREWLAFLSPSGQQQIIEFVHEARETRGEHWVEEMKTEFPFAAWLAELVCTKNADDALAEICDAYPNWPVRWAAGEQIKNLHARLKIEIERKR